MNRLLLIGLLLCAASGCAKDHGRATVLWISIDALRSDYLQRVKPPTLSRLAREGAYTTHEVPVFPSLTFPNHAAQATGRAADGSGVPLNTFYDRTDGLLHDKPDESSILRAEPIWVTAKRQGLRVAVINWPMSHAQTGPWRSDYFLNEYDPTRPDAQRLEQVAQILQEDRATHDKPLRLIMTYLSNVDTIGHRSGPDSPELDRALLDADAQIQRLLDSVIEWFNATRASTDDLYVVISTDHGMQQIHTRVSLERALGADLLVGAKITTGGPVAVIYLSEVPPDQRPERARRIVEKLQEHKFISSWTSNQVPPRLHFTDPDRIGDVVAVLQAGYTWTTDRTALTQPTVPGSIQGAHGYDPGDVPTMLGAAIIWRYRHPLGGIDLGEIHNTQWHATVAHLLGIDPADGADPRAIHLPGESVVRSAQSR